MDYSTGGGDAAAGGLSLVFLACWGIAMIVGLLLLVLNIWMLIDVLGRQEYEFPGTSGSSKNTWVILMIVGLFLSFGWIVALIYYFKVFKVIKRGTVAPPWAAGTPGAPQAPPVYAPPAPPVYVPPAPPVYVPPAPMEPPAPPAPEAPPASPEPPAPPAPPAP